MAETRLTCMPDFVEMCISGAKDRNRKVAPEDHGMDRNKRMGPYWALRCIKITGCHQGELRVRSPLRFIRGGRRAHG